MYSIVMVGSNPSQKSNSVMPFWRDTKSYKTIQDWRDIIEMDVPDHCRIEQIYFLNVSDLPTPNNRPLKVSEIKANLVSLKQKLDPYISYDMKIVALGKSAEKAMTLLDIDFYAMPHPSGLNRQLNNKKFVEEKIKGLQNYLSPSKV